MRTNNNMAVRPIAIQVRIGEFSGDVMQRRRPIVRLLVNRVTLWTPILYYMSSNNLRLRCEAWCNDQPTGIGKNLLDELLPCPPRVTQVRLFNSGFVEDSGINIIFKQIRLSHWIRDMLQIKRGKVDGYFQYQFFIWQKPCMQLLRKSRVAS